MQIEKSARRENFQLWWNEHGFYAGHPLYRIYEDLFMVGADLDYVNFLRGWISQITRGFDFPIYRKAIRRARRTKAAFPPLTSAHEYNLYFLSTLMHDFEKFQSLSNQMELLTAELTASMEWLKKSRALPASKTAEKKRESSEWIKMVKAIQGLVKIYQQQTKKRSEIMAAYLQRLTEPERELLGTLNQVQEQLNLPLPKRGRPADPWGSFLLLAVSEHLRHKSEKPGKPYYPLVARLLQKLQAMLPQKLGRHPTSEKSAKVRVSNLSRSHLGLKDTLRLIEKQFYRAQDALKGV
jgi:hypothetical protein